MSVFWFAHTLGRNSAKLLEPIRMFLLQGRSLFEEERKLLLRLAVSFIIDDMLYSWFLPLRMLNSALDD